MRVRWGIIGAGAIASVFVEDLAGTPGEEITAVYARDPLKGAAFAHRHQLSRHYDSLTALLQDRDIDAVYVATPHVCHCEQTIAALEAGKAVLCEKPLAINTEQAAAMIAAARNSRAFLMEAMFTRFVPVYRDVLSWLHAGLIGTPRLVSSDFSFNKDFDPQCRLFSPQLGGGSLLDVGVYCVALASLVYRQPPTRVAGLAELTPEGVDWQASATLGYANGALATIFSGLRVTTPHEAWIHGDTGSIQIHAPFWRATRATLRVQGQVPIVAEASYEKLGHQFQVMEVHRCLREGRIESEFMPLDESLAIMQTMDRLRELWGLRYPCETD